MQLYTAAESLPFLDQKLAIPQNEAYLTKIVSPSLKGNMLSSAKSFGK